MCYNYEVSVTSFVIGIVGIIINMIVFKKNPLYLGINFFWIGVILMQLWEAILWKDYKCELFSKIAKYTNLIQPILLLIVLLIPNYIKKNKINLKLVYLVLGIYILSIFPMILKDYGCIKDKNGIVLKWWDIISGTIYLITIFALIKLLLPNRMFKYQSLIIFANLIIANVFHFMTSKNYMKSIIELPGRLGSIWCWVAAAAPCYNYFLFKNNI